MNKLEEWQMYLTQTRMNLNWYRCCLTFDALSNQNDRHSAHNCVDGFKRVERV
jgi:hypothetical protein